MLFYRTEWFNGSPECFETVLRFTMPFEFVDIRFPLKIDCVSVYPPKLAKRVRSIDRPSVVESENAYGKDANFVCGSYVRFSVRIDPEAKQIDAVGFRSNGCGYMLAAADILANCIDGKKLSGLNGLQEPDLFALVERELGIVESGRSDCIKCTIAALQACFESYREKQIEEFRGERALICTCFGVSEETVANGIANGSMRSVDEVTAKCNAGGGCGSCRMLIQEMLDVANSSWMR